MLEGHCERLGRDIGEITKTRMGTVYIARDRRGRRRQVRARGRRRVGPRAHCARRPSSAIPDEVAEQVQAYLDAGLDGVTITIPDVHDLETVALAGETLGAVIGTRTT